MGNHSYSEPDLVRLLLRQGYILNSGTFSHIPCGTWATFQFLTVHQLHSLLYIGYISISYSTLATLLMVHWLYSLQYIGYIYAVHWLHSLLYIGYIYITYSALTALLSVYQLGTFLTVHTLTTIIVHWLHSLQNIGYIPYTVVHQLHHLNYIGYIPCGAWATYLEVH